MRDEPCKCEGGCNWRECTECKRQFDSDSIIVIDGWQICKECLDNRKIRGDQ